MFSLTKNNLKPSSSIFSHNKRYLFPKDQQNLLFSKFFEQLIDGILILSEQGELIEANVSAARFCQKLVQDCSLSNLELPEICTSCQSLIKNCFPVLPRKNAINSQISVYKWGNFRFRTQWLRLEETSSFYQIIIIEDCDQSLQNLVNTQVEQNGLTPREAEVWLLSRSDYTYQEIARQLYITQNTVKKHMKNIYAKLRANKSDDK